MQLSNLYKIWIVFLVMSISSCRKDFLDKTPNKSLLVPTTLADFRALLDNNQVMNISPSLAFLSADDFHISETGYVSLVTPVERNCYLWLPETDLYEGRSVNDWTTPYLQVFTANIVLDGLKNINAEIDEANFNEIKGNALFSRAFAFYQLSILFAPPYNPLLANDQLGIPLKLSSDVNIVPIRSSLKETYAHIIDDLKQAILLLPLSSAYKTRPNRSAANLLLSRIYLSMMDYEQAEAFAGNAIQLGEGLLDYNTLNVSSNRPFPVALPNNNKEILFYSSMITYGFLSSTQTGVDLDLFRSYHNNDLRRELFYRDRGNNIFQFKGNYTGAASQFAGISINEAILIKAECEARRGFHEEAMATLNELLLKRWKIGTYVPLIVTNSDMALKIILEERRKELVARDVRWADLRRLNLDDRFARTIYRTTAGREYSLPPNDRRYTLPIPIQEIRLSGIEQNER